MVAQAIQFALNDLSLVKIGGEQWIEMSLSPLASVENLQIKHVPNRVHCFVNAFAKFVPTTPNGCAVVLHRANLLFGYVAGLINDPCDFMKVLLQQSCTVPKFKLMQQLFDLRVIA